MIKPLPDIWEEGGDSVKPGDSVISKSRVAQSSNLNGMLCKSNVDDKILPIPHGSEWFIYAF